MAYIIYLHPKQNSEACNQLCNFWESGKQIMPENLAFLYPFHATLVSFFDTDEPENVAEYAKKCIIEVNVKSEQIIGDNNIKMVSLKSHRVDSFIESVCQNFSYIKSKVVGKLHLTLTHHISQNNIANANLLLQNIDISKWTNDWTIIMWNRVPKDNWKIFSVIF